MRLFERKKNREKFVNIILGLLCMLGVFLISRSGARSLGSLDVPHETPILQMWYFSGGSVLLKEGAVFVLVGGGGDRIILEKIGRIIPGPLPAFDMLVMLDDTFKNNGGLGALLERSEAHQLVVPGHANGLVVQNVVTAAKEKMIPVSRIESEIDVVVGSMTLHFAPHGKTMTLEVLYGDERFTLPGTGIEQYCKSDGVTVDCQVTRF